MNQALEDFKKVARTASSFEDEYVKYADDYAKWIDDLIRRGLKAKMELQKGNYGRDCADFMGKLHSYRDWYTIWHQ